MSMEKIKDTNHQVLIKSQQNCLKQGVGQFTMRSISLLNLLGIRRNCLSSGTSCSLYLCIRRVIKGENNYRGIPLLSTM